MYITGKREQRNFLFGLEELCKVDPQHPLVRDVFRLNPIPAIDMETIFIEYCKDQGPNGILKLAEEITLAPVYKWYTDKVQGAYQELTGKKIPEAHDDYMPPFTL